MMKHNRKTVFALFIIMRAFSPLTYVTHAQEPLLLPFHSEEGSPVTASLAFDVSEISPGSTFNAIITIVHAPQWHTYSPERDSGGLPTVVEWDLPPGFKVDPIQWPTPMEFEDRGFKGRGYTDTLTLKAAIHTDKSINAKNTVRIGAKISWLACKESCVPGSAAFEYMLPVKRTDGIEPQNSHR